MNTDNLQLRRLREALLSAFPTRPDLEMMVFDQLNENLWAIAKDSNLEDTVFRLIQHSVARGQLQKLVRGSLNQNPHNPQLRSAAKELGMVKSQNLPQHDQQVPNRVDEVRVQHRKDAIYHYNRRNYKQAEDAYLQVLNFSSENTERAEVWLRIAHMRYEHKRWRSALEAYRMATHFDATNAQTFMEIGRISYIHLSEYQQALDAYTKAFELDPHNIEVYQNTCALLLQLERFDEALETCERAISQGLDHAQFMRYRGQILYECKHYQEACESYQAALQIMPKNAYLHKEEGDVFRKIGQLHDARNAYEHALETYSSAQMHDPSFRDEINRILKKLNRMLRDL